MLNRTPVILDPTAEIQQLATNFVLPEYPMPPEVERLATLLSSVKDTDIRDKEAFVLSVNTLLRKSGYRCRLPNGNTGLLRHATPKGLPGYIQFTRSKGGGGGRLGKISILLVRIPIEHGIRKMVSQPTFPTLD